MVLKFFRKPLFSFFLASLVMFVSCTNDNLSENKLTSEELKQFHKSVETEFNSVNLNSVSMRTDEELDKLYVENANYLNQNGIEVMFRKNNIDPILLEQFEFYQQNYENENVYQLLIDKYNFKTIDDVAFLIKFIETYDKVVDGLNLEGKLGENMHQRISWSCALAIAGTIAATAGFAFVTGGAGLIVALISKGLATASIIDSCT